MIASEILKEYSPDHDNMIGILHALQDNNPYNYLDERDMKAVAEFLNTSLSHVYGVATYYTMFSIKPRGRYIIRACNSPVCHMEGSINIIDELKSALSIDIGETTKDRMFTLELTECLGQCDNAPVMMINKDIFGDLNREKIGSILKEYKSK